MPYLAQELYHEINAIDSSTKGIKDIFQNQFTYLDKSLTEIPSELSSTMAIVLHVRDTFHRILQSRRAILYDITLFLSDEAKKQVNTFLVAQSINSVLV